MKLLKYPKKMQVNIRSWNGECFSKHKQKNIIQKNDRWTDRQTIYRDRQTKRQTGKQTEDGLPNG